VKAHQGIKKPMPAAPFLLRLTCTDLLEGMKIRGSITKQSNYKKRNKHEKGDF
jgi:hypothetical protein